MAKQLNVSTATVTAFLKKNNVVVENKQNKLENDLDIDIIPGSNTIIKSVTITRLGIPEIISIIRCIIISTLPP